MTNPKCDICGRSGTADDPVALFEGAPADPENGPSAAEIPMTAHVYGCEGGRPEDRDDLGPYSPEYLAFMEEQEAIMEGLATELTHCYLCYLEKTGHADMSRKQDLGPLRGIAGTFTAIPEDPTAALRLIPCGHVII